VRAISLFAAVVLLLVTPALASADVFTVNTTADANDSVCEGIVAGDCPLRAAVNDAANGDTINVPQGTYVLTVPGGVLLVDVSVTIVGAGARQTVINGNNASRVIHVVPPSPTAPISVGVSGVTLTNGNGVGGNNPNGGAVHVALGATLALSDSAVTNSRSQTANGGGIYTDGHLQLNRVTVSGNQANSPTGVGSGGGIYHNSNNDPARIVAIANSTISGNSVNGNGGGIFSANGVLGLQSTTIAGNTAANGSGLFKPGSGTSIQDSIVAASSGVACGGAGVAGIVGSNNLATDATCGGTFVAANPLLGALANNGGPTDTHALGSTSPAIGAASPAPDRCTGTDQRGVARPQGAGCDIGSFEFVGSTLTVTTTVTNNDGGEDGPGDFSVRVRDAAGADVAGSPQPGRAGGTTFALAPGTYTVSADGPNLYTVAIGGACSATGAVTVGDNQAATCTITADDRAPRPGRSVGVIPVRGTVRIRLPGGRFRVLLESDLLPNGTTIDTLRGRVTLIAATNQSGSESKADFYDGVFKLRQSKGSRPITTLTLTDRLTCPRAGTAIAAAKKRKRRLWGDGSGRFRTKGKHSAATVVGTKWLVEDRCTSTLTRVVRGRVSVRDFVKKKTIIVRRGKRYIARARP
jgi:hypothetical protein